MSGLYPDRLDPADQMYVGLFAGGAAGGATFALIDVAFYGQAWPFVAVYALLGASILPSAELASRLGEAWWTKGLLMGVAGGVLLGLSSQALVGEDPLLVDLIANVVGGIVGGLMWKYTASFKKAALQNGTAARMR